MKLQFYKNIDVVQINVKKGVTEYFLPQNVDWADKKIDKLILYSSHETSGEVSPIDGVTPVYTREKIQSVYLDLYSKAGEQITYNLSASAILHTNNNPLELNSVLSLQLSKLVFTEAPESDGCILLYVFWDTKTADGEVPTNSVTARFDIAANEELPLSKVIDTYIYSQGKKLKGLYVWGGFGYWSGMFITLRDRNYKTVVKLLPLGMCRPPMGVPAYLENERMVDKVQSVQTQPMYFDCADIDFDNSFLYSGVPGNTTDLTITFLY